MEDIKNIIAANMVSLRKERGFSQAEIAERFGYSDKAVSKWERGESMPDIYVLKQIADFYDVTVDYLLHKEHEAGEKKSRINKKVIIWLSVCLVWLIATTLFVGLTSADFLGGREWMTFMYAVPVSLVVLLVMNSIFGMKKLNYLIVSLLIWSLLLCIYLSFLKGNHWLIFIIGVPSQIIVLLWMFLKKKN